MSDIDARIAALSNETLGIIRELVADRDHWKANHDNMVARNEFLATRTDLSFEEVNERNRRLSVVYELERLRKENADQAAEIARHHKDFARWEEMADKGAQQIEENKRLREHCDFMADTLTALGQQCGRLVNEGESK